MGNEMSSAGLDDIKTSLRTEAHILLSNMIHTVLLLNVTPEMFKSKEVTVCPLFIKEAFTAMCTLIYFFL